MAVGGEANLEFSFSSSEHDGDGTAYIYVGGHKDCIALLKFTPDLSAIESIAADNAAVEYFNLQGVKVAKAENGLFIKKQGNKVSKVIL